MRPSKKGICKTKKETKNQELLTSPAVLLEVNSPTPQWRPCWRRLLRWWRRRAAPLQPSQKYEWSSRRSAGRTKSTTCSLNLLYSGLLFFPLTMLQEWVCRSSGVKWKLHVQECEREWGATHRVDAGQLLGELQHHGDDQRLAVQRRAQQLQDGHLLLPHHLPALLLHLLHVGAHVRRASQLLQHWNEQREEVTMLGSFADKEQRVKTRLDVLFFILAHKHMNKSVYWQYNKSIFFCFTFVLLFFDMLLSFQPLRILRSSCHLCFLFLVIRGENHEAGCIQPQQCEALEQNQDSPFLYGF